LPLIFLEAQRQIAVVFAESGAGRSIWLSESLTKGARDGGRAESLIEYRAGLSGFDGKNSARFSLDWKTGPRVALCQSSERQYQTEQGDGVESEMMCARHEPLPYSLKYSGFAGMSCIP
jgi:hypothetical protein